MDEMAGGDARRREPFHPANLPGILPRQLHQPLRLVRTGKLDFLLLLPVNTRFVISLRQVDLGSFVNAASALAVMAYAAHR